MSNLSVIAERLSRERLGTYGADADLVKAIELYEWNSEIAGAWWGVIGDVKVILRNAMHEQLTRWSARRLGTGPWYADPGGVLSGEARHSIARARSQVTREGRAELPGKVVAELSLGFWRFLLSARYERSLWVPSLRHAFPHLMGPGMRREARMRRSSGCMGCGTGSRIMSRFITGRWRHCTGMR